MGENTSTRPGRLIAALFATVAVGGLLAGCAGTAGAARPSGTAAPSTSAPAQSDPAETPPAPEQTVPAPAETQSTAKAAVVPFITSATPTGDGIDVGALVPKVVETGGTCTATATMGDVTITKSGAAVAASSYTGCPQLLITGDGLTAGTWSVTVTYDSDSSAGGSKAQTVTVG